MYWILEISHWKAETHHSRHSFLWSEPPWSSPSSSLPPHWGYACCCRCCHVDLWGAPNSLAEDFGFPITVLEIPSDPRKLTRFNQFRTFKESLVLTHDAGNDPGQVNHDASLGSLVSRDTWGSTSRYRTDPSRCPKKCHFDGAKRVHIWWFILLFQFFDLQNVHLKPLP